MANFGYTAGNGTEDNIVAAKPAGAKYVDAVAGFDLWAIKALLRKTASGTALVTAGVYSQVANVPHDRLVDSNEQSVVYHATEFTSYTFALDALLSVDALQNIWLVLHTDSIVRYKYASPDPCFGELFTADAQTYVSGATPAVLTADVDDVYGETTENIYGVGLYRPGSLTATRNGSQIDLSWTCFTDADRTGYDLYRKVDNGAYESFSTPALDATTATDDTITAGHSYQYEIRAKTAANQGTFVVSGTVGGSGGGRLLTLGAG